MLTKITKVFGKSIPMETVCPKHMLGNSFFGICLMTSNFTILIMFRRLVPKVVIFKKVVPLRYSKFQ